MQKLSEAGCILIESNKQYSIVSICNWKIYQADEEQKITSNGQATDKQLTSNEHAIDTNKNDKNEKNVKNKDIVVPENGKPYVPFNEIIDFFNTVTGKDFKSTSKVTRAHISARWGRGIYS